MKKLFLFALAVTALFSSCEKDPDLNKLDSDYAVYTNYDNGIQFNKFSSYYLPDSILVAGGGMRAQYWKDENAQKIISEVVAEMDDRGYTRVDDKEKADIGLQLSYAQQTTQIITPGYGYGYGWWGAGFWGPFWNDWYYPYPVSYSYDTGTFVAEMVDLTAKSANQNKKVDLPVIWHAYASGLVYNNSRIDMQLTLRAVEQAFEQSPYLNILYTDK